jgi:hypothetical protein
MKFLCHETRHGRDPPSYINSSAPAHVVGIDQASKTRRNLMVSNQPPAKPRKALSPAAERALAEAAARRAAEVKPGAGTPKESPAREGPDPTRYGDWERKGIASDF